MRTVQMTLNEQLVKEVDIVAKEMTLNRSALTRQALQLFLDKYKEAQLVKQHKQGYISHPVSHEEQTEWQDEHIWGDDNETW